MRYSRLLPTLVLAALLAPAAAQYVESPADVRIYYDLTVPAQLLWPYTARVLLLADTEGRGDCFAPLPNGTVSIACQPLADEVVRITYLEAGASAVVRTDGQGVAEASFRILSFPKASFRVEAMQGQVYRTYQVEVRPWGVAALASFAAMLASAVIILRRCYG